MIQKFLIIELTKILKTYDCLWKKFRKKLYSRRRQHRRYVGHWPTKASNSFGRRRRRRQHRRRRRPWRLSVGLQGL